MCGRAGAFLPPRGRTYAQAGMPVPPGTVAPWNNLLFPPPVHPLQLVPRRVFRAAAERGKVGCVLGVLLGTVAQLLVDRGDPPAEHRGGDQAGDGGEDVGG